ncbi:MAG: heat-shock protein Hsp20 [Rhodospirillaceae bacterium]|nr:heat-shock protein Hsp20 [Rhodospirillaceae bacterium]
MSRMTTFDSPMLLGFDHVERMLDRIAKASNDGYPPYNIEQIDKSGLRITLAVAGFSMDDLSVTLEDNQLAIRGKQVDDSDSKTYLHRGIAARQFVKTFLLAEGMEVVDATLECGLLHVDLERPLPEVRHRTIKIKSLDYDVSESSG